MAIDPVTLRGCRDMLATVLARLDEVLDGTEEYGNLRRGKTPDAILRLLAKAGPLRPSEILEKLQDAGRDVTMSAVYAACSRHVTADNLVRDKHGVYRLPGQVGGEK